MAAEMSLPDRVDARFLVGPVKPANQPYEPRFRGFANSFEFIGFCGVLENEPQSKSSADRRLPAKLGRKRSARS